MLTANRTNSLPATTNLVLKGQMGNQISNKQLDKLTKTDVQRGVLKILTNLERKLPFSTIRNKRLQEEKIRTVHIMVYTNFARREIHCRTMINRCRFGQIVHPTDATNVTKWAYGHVGNPTYCYKRRERIGANEDLFTTITYCKSSPRPLSCVRRCSFEL